MIIICCRLTAVKRSRPFFMERIAVLIPILAESLIAAIFGSPHRMLLALVDIKHFTAVFRFVNIEHLTRADGTSAERVELVADFLHLNHMFTADRLITTFVKQDTRVITVIDNGIAHQFRTLFPLAALTVFLRIAGRHGLNKADTVARLHILFPGSDVHPADKVRIAFHHEAIGVVTQPCGDGKPHCRPFIAGTLGIALHLDDAVVQPYLSPAELCLAETGTGHNLVKNITAVVQQSRIHGVQIAVSPAPEVQFAHIGSGFHGSRLTGFQHCLAAMEGLHRLTVRIGQAHPVTEAACLATVVFHLGLGMYLRLAAFDVEVGGVDVYTGCFQVAVQRQSLIYLVRHIQKYVLGNTAIVGVEITVVPLIFGISAFFTVEPVVINTYSQHIISFFHIGSKVESYGHDPVFMQS